MSLTVQTLLKLKQFGDYSQGTRPVQHKAKEWQDQSRGKERALRLITRALLGVPSAHHGDQDHPMWCFGFGEEAVLVVMTQKGSGQIRLLARGEEQSADLRAAVEFLLAEVGTKLRQI